MGGQGGCEWRSKVFVKIQKKKKFFWQRWGGGGVRSGVGVGEVRVARFFFLGGGGSGWGVRVDVNGEVKFL